jgi:putative IMPACT (imprinted ancient) family translation regulator
VPYDACDDLQARLKRDHPKASHVVYAVRYLNDQGQIVENSSDDGEPRGAAGVPVLNVLRGEDLIGVAVLIVRYFGGTKLGMGGMVRAYTLAAKEVIAHASLVAYVHQREHRFDTLYSDIEKTLYRLKQLGITQYKREFGIHDVRWIIVGNVDAVEAFAGGQDNIRH